jgi:hypothetical protein
VIVAPDSLADIYQKLADYQTRTGRSTVVRSLSTVRSLDPRSNDLAQATRSFLRSAYELWGTRYAILAADHDAIPMRIVRVLLPDVEEIPTDMYYADLDGTWDGNGNGIYGEVADNLDMTPDLIVGRLSASTRAEATVLVDKALLYAKTPPATAKELMLAEVLFPSTWQPGQGYSTDGAVNAESLRVKAPGCAVVERRYENSTVYPGSLPLTKANALAALAIPRHIVVHVGHGSRSQLSVGSEIVTASELTAVNNDSASLWISNNCASAAVDYDCVAERLLRKPKGGAFAYIGATRDAWPTNDATISEALFEHLFGPASPTLGQACGGCPRGPRIRGARRDAEPLGLLRDGAPRGALPADLEVPADLAHGHTPRHGAAPVGELCRDGARAGGAGRVGARGRVEGGGGLPGRLHERVGAGDRAVPSGIDGRLLVRGRRAGSPAVPRLVERHGVGSSEVLGAEPVRARRSGR